MVIQDVNIKGSYAKGIWELYTILAVFCLKLSHNEKFFKEFKFFIT